MNSKVLVVLFVVSLSVLLNSSFVSHSLASDSDDVMSALTLKVHSALQCASQFGSVSNVQITDMDKRDGELYIRGQYFMVGFWGRAPGTFKATANRGLKLTWMQWKEPNNGGTVSDYCLN